MALQEYKCPCCGGAVEFNSTVQKMKCPYCDTEFDMQTLVDLDKELNEAGSDSMDWDTSMNETFSDSEVGDMKVYKCQSCGGEIIGDSNTGATKCPYCDNPIVMMGAFRGDLKPVKVIPFKLDREAAKQKLQEHYKGKKLLPKVFKDQNHLDEIQGIYVPYWIFDSDAEADVHYRATKVRRWSDNNYNYKETSHYSVHRAGTLDFENVPMDGSTKMDDALMESLEPYDFSEAVDFQTAYLAGYLADRYDVQAEDCIPRINERVKNATMDEFRKTVTGFDSVNVDRSSIRLNNGKALYVLYPMYLLNTTWNGQTYTFAMNGQTGKFVGDLPMDKSAYLKYLFLVAGIAAVVVFILCIIFANCG